MLFCVAPAKAGETINEAGALGLVTDKWDEKEVERFSRARLASE
jgi:hypothetical protein